jgi:hypothetical protein
MIYRDNNDRLSNNTTYRIYDHLKKCHIVKNAIPTELLAIPQEQFCGEYGDYTYQFIITESPVQSHIGKYMLIGDFDSLIMLQEMGVRWDNFEED